MIFNENAPDSQYAINPDYMDSNKLAWTGYKKNGQTNLWGDISSFIPVLGQELNLAARGIAKNNGASDTWENIKEDTTSRFQKLGLTAGIGMGIAGGVTGNPALLKNGLSMAANFGGQLAFDQQGLGLTDDAEYVYR